MTMLLYLFLGLVGLIVAFKLIGLIWALIQDCAGLVFSFIVMGLFVLLITYIF